MPAISAEHSTFTEKQPVRAERYVLVCKERGTRRRTGDVTDVQPQPITAATPLFAAIHHILALLCPGHSMSMAGFTIAASNPLAD
ncbi:hypothetical protein DPV78_010027 [Talaromyces pinophilus]|nr:hypothetical protein DPV78_010027 [Talaromyces pinophilus]